MNWEIIGSTGEWAGAIAVVVTLLQWDHLDDRATERQLSNSTIQWSATANCSAFSTPLCLLDAAND